MANKSDHNKPRTNIVELLPDVYRSDINQTVFEASVNRHLTPDDTIRVAGFIGEGNAAAIINRQIEEPTPHRQAFQLEPVVYTKISSNEHTMTQQGFLTQLELMGVDINRLPSWANVLQFNWVPPVNIDMLVNYADYYWRPAVRGALPQYFTIEDRCSKAKGKVGAYSTLIEQRGELFPIRNILAVDNTFEIEGKYDDIFVSSFIFFTKNTTNININNTFWTVSSSSYDVNTNITSIVVVEDIGIHQDTQPSSTAIGRWWVNTTNGTLLAWNGTLWTPASSAIAADLSLSELRDVFQQDANCICDQQSGWDVTLWDDNQAGALLWNNALLASISFSDESSWTAANGPRQFLSLWYDTSSNVLYQSSDTAPAGGWVAVVNNFSVLLERTQGNSMWDFTVGCELQESTQWSSQNEWIHKTQVTSFDGITRAQLPILEYSSMVELNKWSEVEHVWKYRASVDRTFEVSQAPTRIELEPIKGYAARNVVGAWTIYLYSPSETQNRDIDFSLTFKPGYRFKIVDDVTSAIYTVATSTHKRMDATDESLTGIPEGYFVTVVTIVENTFSSPANGGVTSDNARIEPLLTSMGDPWLGYHVHWVLSTTTDATATAPRSSNVVISESLNGATEPSVVVGIGEQSLGVSHQDITIGSTGVTTIPLAASLQYNPSTATHYATPNSGELRVYINGVRQYGNYTEVVSAGTPSYTAIGSSLYNTVTIPYVSAVVFDTPLQPFSVVRIEVGPAAHVDSGMYAVPVRTVEDEAEFTLGVVTGTQPIYRSLTQYHRTEQAKTVANQYPLFNMYDPCTGDLVGASPLFAFKESSDSAVNTNVQRRVVMSADGREYEFEQYLLKDDNDSIYAYRNVGLLASLAHPVYWYNPLKRQLQHWDGEAWTDRIISGNVQHVPVVSSTAPELPLQGSIWLNSDTRELFTYVGTSWTATPVVVANADPSLQTIWRHGLNNETYTPQYVDSNRQPVNVGSPEGDWEMLDPWFYNPEHHNRSVVKYSEIVTHLSSILRAQPRIPGLVGGGVYTLTQDQYNYGIGGTIKEHNDNFDILVSAVNVNSVTPVGLIEFAEDQYAASLLTLREIFNDRVVSLFLNTTKETIIDQGGVITDYVLDRYAQNEFLTTVYGDTTAYDATTLTGVKNWIATVPIFGLGTPVQPYIIAEDAFVEVVHHDGHRSSIQYSLAEEDRFARQLVNTPDSRVAGGTYGVVSTDTPPANQDDFLATFSGSLPRVGVYWYRVTGSIRTLYRFNAYHVGTVAPSFYLNDEEIPDGIRYYNTITETTYEKNGLAWIAITSVGAGDLSPMWQPVSLAASLGRIYITVEQQLYERALAVSPVFDYATLTPNNAEQAVYDEYERQRFFAFVAERDIRTPLANTSYTPSNAFTWNYTTSVVTTPPQTVTTPQPAGSWQETYLRWYGTPYPHLEPWSLQGYTNKPQWWDEEYLNTNPSAYGGRRWKYTHSTTTGMWTNILQGIVPVGKLLPTGSVSSGAVGEARQYAYVSVNITDTTIPGGYAPDALLPPYYDNTAIAISEPAVRSLYTNLNAEVFATSADYVFGDVGPIEWLWKTSTERVYDNLIIAFLMQPVKFMHAMFGMSMVHVDMLQLDTTFCHVHTHRDALFHGDVYNTDQVYSANGINQWYVNFNRYNGHDTNGEFRQMWAGWTPKLGYQFAGIIDTETFEVFNKYYDVVEQDYNIVLSKSGVLRDIWIDAFDVSLLSIPPAITQYNNESQWKLEVRSLATTNRTIDYYGVRKYPVSVDTSTDMFTLFSYDIVDASSSTDRFFVAGNYADTFVPGLTIVVSGSSGNDGSYTVLSSVYELTTNVTRINVVEPVVNPTADGRIDIPSKIMPWDTGDIVYMFSGKMMPTPVLADTPYYVIKTGNRTFKLAETPQDASDNISIDITSRGQGDIMVGEVASTFVIMGGAGNSREVWYHFAIDRFDTKTIESPDTVYGMQNFINFVDGYAEYLKDVGVSFNKTEAGEIDPDTGRGVSWQVETERFIDWAFGIRRTRMTVNDRYNIAVADVNTDEFEFTGPAPGWSSGKQVVVSAAGTLPSPLFANTAYYYIPTTDGRFKLSVSRQAAGAIDITTSGSGTITISTYSTNNSYPSFEMNPVRNNMWISTPQGMVADIVAGPYADIRTSHTIFDQYGRPLTTDKILVYRRDKETRISVLPELTNDVEPFIQSIGTPYDYLHMGGCHAYIEGYEHVVLFEDYSVAGALVYDSFLGLNTKRFDLDYFEKAQFTLRPTLGGFYLLAGKFRRNIEGSISDLRNYYDTFIVPETRESTKYARALLGYTGRKDYFNLVNLNSKSQFLFHRGMIQAKGSVGSVNAYINSRRFVDAKIDEFWAWKVAEFGDSRAKLYPQIKLKATDGITDDVRLHFMAPQESVDDPEFSGIADDGFEVVSFRDGENDRWAMFPEQRSDLGNQTLFLDAKVASMMRIYINDDPPPREQASMVDFWVEPGGGGYNTHTFTSDGADVDAPAIAYAFSGSSVYIKLDTLSDDVRVIRRNLSDPDDLREYETEILRNVPAPVEYAYVVTSSTSLRITDDVTTIFVPYSRFDVRGSTADAAYVVESSTYNAGLGVTDIVVTTTIASSGGVVIPSLGVSEYTMVNSSTLKMDRSAFTGVVTIFTMIPATEALNPSKLIDVKANTVISEVPLWDPARGMHYHVARHNVDLMTPVDPARYNTPVNPSGTNALDVYRAWNSAEVDTVWFDTSMVGYVPYYDPRIMTDVSDRMANWGKLADWASVRVYQWVASSVPPLEWDARAATEESDVTIPVERRATGTVRKVTFKRQRRQFTSSIGVGSTITLSPALAAGELNVGDTIIFAGETVPVATNPDITIEPGVEYYVVSVSGNNIQIAVEVDDTVTDAISFTNIPAVTATIVPSFRVSDWERHLPQFATINVATTEGMMVLSPIVPLPTSFDDGDNVSVYVNGVLAAQNLVVSSSSITLTGMQLHEKDVVVVVRPNHAVTPEEAEFDPAVEDDGTIMVQWKEDVEYTAVVEINAAGESVLTYYFWIENGITADTSKPGALTLKQTAEQLVNIPIPYAVLQQPLDDPYLIGLYGYGISNYGQAFSLSQLAEQFTLIPVFYRQAILRNASVYLTDDDRYIWRFTRDLTLRDDLDSTRRRVNLKNKHAEWMLIRKEQLSSIPRELWDKLTEAVAGRKVNDGNQRVPSLERVLYDETYGTDTRFGLGIDQAFVDAKLGLATILSYLRDPSIDFTPTNIDDFFARHDFTTSDGIVNAMNEIYVAFDVKHVNRIWFATLDDALSTRAQFRDLMKTSWIALHGIRVLEVGGLFDD